jgi:hypothetical protein
MAAKLGGRRRSSTAVYSVGQERWYGGAGQYESQCRSTAREERGELDDSDLATSVVGSRSSPCWLPLVHRCQLLPFSPRWLQLGTRTGGTIPVTTHRCGNGFSLRIDMWFDIICVDINSSRPDPSRGPPLLAPPLEHRHVALIHTSRHACLPRPLTATHGASSRRHHRASPCQPACAVRPSC